MAGAAAAARSACCTAVSSADRKRERSCRFIGAVVVLVIYHAIFERRGY